MNVTSEPKPALNHDEIANLAWQIWQAEGGQPGRDQEYWLKAEQQLLKARQPNSDRTNGSGAKRKAASSGGKKPAGQASAAMV